MLLIIVSYGLNIYSAGSMKRDIPGLKRFEIFYCIIIKLQRNAISKKDVYNKRISNIFYTLIII
jgi:hypothetical protein